MQPVPFIKSNDATCSVFRFVRENSEALRLFHELKQACMRACPTRDLVASSPGKDELYSRAAGVSSASEHGTRPSFREATRTVSVRGDGEVSANVTR